MPDIQVGDLVRHRRNHIKGVWLVTQVDTLSWACELVKGTEKVWFDMDQMDLVVPC
jgi:hypothetical protein